MKAWTVAVVLGVCAALVSATQPAALQPEVDAAEAEAGSGAVRVLLELHESAQADASFQEHVDTLLLSLREQAHTAAGAEGDAADAEEVAAAADVADAEAAEDAAAEAAEAGDTLRVFGEAPEVKPITTTAEAEEGTLNAEEWSAGPALLEADAESDEAESDAEGEALAAAADVADAEAAEDAVADAVAEGGDAEVRVFGEAPEAKPLTAEAEAEEGTLNAEEWSAGPAFLEIDESDADADADADTDGDADTETEADTEADADADEQQMPVEMEGDAAAEHEIVEAIPSAASQEDEEWTAGAALLETEMMEQELDADETEEEAEEEDEAEEAEADAEAEDASEVAFVQVQGDWKDPPVWWKAPEEEMANADQQPWPLDPNFPMSVLDPPPNLPLANIEDPNNFAPMADPNFSFNIDPSAFPQTNEKVGTDDPSFASFSINGR